MERDTIIVYQSVAAFRDPSFRLEIRTLAPIGPSIEYAKTKLDRRVETVILQFRVDAVGFLTCCFESVRHDVGEMTERVRSSTRFNHPFAPHRFSYVAFRNVQNNWT